MGDPVTTALVVTAIASVATSAYSASKQPKPPKTPKGPVDPTTNEGPAVDQGALDRQRKRRQAGAMGRQDTLLTGPLGLTGEPASASKTLLGS